MDCSGPTGAASPSCTSQKIAVIRAATFPGFTILSQSTWPRRNDLPGHVSVPRETPCVAHESTVCLMHESRRLWNGTGSESRIDPLAPLLLHWSEQLTEASHTFGVRSLQWLHRPFHVKPSARPVMYEFSDPSCEVQILVRHQAPPGRSGLPMLLVGSWPFHVKHRFLRVRGRGTRTPAGVATRVRSPALARLAMTHLNSTFAESSSGSEVYWLASCMNSMAYRLVTY